MDASTSQRPVACGLEVKEQGGDYNVAVMQLGIWCAAGLELVRTLWEEGSNAEGRVNTLRPMVGWTVVGHDWKLHIAWKEADGSVVSFPLGSCSHGVLILLANTFLRVDSRRTLAFLDWQYN